MTLWLILGVLTLATVALMLRPLVKGAPAAPTRAAYDLEVYRDQLAEVKRDRARGALDADQASAATREIERRMLAAVPPESGSPIATANAAAAAGASPDAPGRNARRWTAFGIATLVPLAALVLYLALGVPGAPDFPFRARQDAARVQAQGMPNIAEALQRLEAHLKATPGDLEGWLLLARSEEATDRIADAAEAYRRAMALAPDRIDIAASYGEVRVAQENGAVPADAHALFERIIAQEPKNVAARFYLGLAKAQSGAGEAALRDWLALEADAPPGAPWLQTLRGQIAATAREFNLDPAKLAPPAKAPSVSSPPPTAAGPSAADIAAAQNMTPEQRAQMIHAMVDRLAARLQSQPDDLEGWRRLGRAYTVLGERDKAIDALDHAAKLAPDDADIKGALDALKGAR